MPQTPHIERHFTGTETVRDIVIGMSDGLTVPFALAAGLSGAVNTTRIIFLPKASTALVASVAITLLALAVFGYVKGHFTGALPLRSAIQTVLIGGIAAGVAFLLARVIS